MITKLGEDYAITSSNCQKFSGKLLCCIQLARSQNDVFIGLHKIPSKFAAAILKRRCDEYLASRDEVGSSVRLNPSMGRLETVEDRINAVVLPIVCVLVLKVASDVQSQRLNLMTGLAILGLGCLLERALYLTWSHYLAIHALFRQIMRGKYRQEALEELINSIADTPVERIDVVTITAQLWSAAAIWS